ncbi:MAG TPA: protein kinase [Steroidobacteraceae bacterium]|jgi:tetratricopeptide (TPR) repeat protein|nr:protein kinase [Steroidobacteraceae bacterium]
MQKLTPGHRVCSRYVLTERIGGGGHGEIWSATDERTGAKVALKFLRPELCDSAEAWAVLSHESLMARRLDHPGILRTEGPVRDSERTVLPMEYAGGGDLRRLRGLSYLRVVPVLIKIAEILAHAHARGVVHRDLKPGNVLFDEAGGVRLADFGASALLGSTANHATGSPFSASPQQLRDEPAAPADDIYGLGTLAYELFSGYPPFYPEFRVEQVLNEAPAPLVAANDIPMRLTRLVMAMLAKDPTERPASMLEVVEVLNLSLADTFGMTAETVPPPDLRFDEPALIEASPRTEILQAPQDLSRRRKAAAVAAAAAARGGSWMAFVGLTILVLLGLILLPRYLGTPVAPTAEAPAPVEETIAPETVAVVAGEDAAAAARDARDAYAAQLAPLEARKAGSWAGAALASAKALAEAADLHYQAAEFTEAAEGYRSATAALQTIASDTAAPLAAALAEGEAALGAGNAALARQAFERALAIDPANAAAKQGSTNTAALEEALGNMAQAARAEAAGQAVEAEAAYKEALRVAPFLDAARDSLQRLQATAAEAEVQRTLAAGLAALRGRRLAEARSAFERVQQLQPDNSAAADGLAQVTAAAAAQDFTALRGRAQSLEREERWHEAVQEYQRALEQDRTLSFAQLGVERAMVRAELGDRLDNYINRPQRLADGSVQDAALATLEQARDLPERGPVLRSQISRVELLLEQYRRPVLVRFSSDNNTQVSIVRVTTLGNFTQREIDLPPGRYTLVGTRQGFRDVRREFEISPGQERLDIAIACNEPI